ncbi:unnamed protein product [Ectocarpus sp. 12 AP-2014]
MEPRRSERQGVMRLMVTTLLVAVGSRAFLITTAVPPRQQHALQSKLQHQPYRPQHLPRRSARYCAGLRDVCAMQQGTAGASGLSATLPVDAAVTRTEALSGFFQAVLLSTAVLTNPPDSSSDGLGVVDDLLADCPSTPTCVSSQDDRPYPFMEPWSYDGPFERAMSRLRNYLEFNGAKVIASSPRYLRVEFEARNAIPASVDDAEFYFTPGDALVQFRCARRNGPTDFGANRRRMDGIRQALKFESIPVLRNRKRALFFGESPIDSFGPSFGMADPSVIYGDADPMSPPFETPSEALREVYGEGGGGADRPAWWGKPLAEAGGFADWRQMPSPAAA